jgi:outer membrane lipopolysaccharide assembly protein LptE/RlpB
MNTQLLRFFAGCLLVLVCSCGYQLVGRGGQFPAGVSKIAVPVFANATKNTEIGRIATNSFIRELLATGRAEVVPVAASQATIRGTVRRYEVERITFDVDRNVTENRMVVSLDVALVLSGEEQPVFEEKNVTRYHEYRVVGDLALQQKDEDAAREEVSRELSQKIIALMTEGF